MVRRALLAYGLLVVLVGIVIALLGLPPQLAIYAIGSGLVVLAAVGLERARYRPKGVRTPTEQATGERFIDPVSGERTEVRFDPLTGRRRYVPEGKGPPKER